MKLTDVDEMTMLDIAGVLKDRASKVRSGEDLEIKKTKKLVEYIPSF